MAQGSGKTRFTRGKWPGESWVARREAAIQAGEFTRPGCMPTKVCKPVKK